VYSPYVDFAHMQGIWARRRRTFAQRRFDGALSAGKWARRVFAGVCAASSLASLSCRWCRRRRCLRHPTPRRHFQPTLSPSTCFTNWLILGCVTPRVGSDKGWRILRLVGPVYLNVTPRWLIEVRARPVEELLRLKWHGLLGTRAFGFTKADLVWCLKDDVCLGALIQGICAAVKIGRVRTKKGILKCWLAFCVDYW